MKETYREIKHSGYEIEGTDIKIHTHILDPDSWHLSIRPLKIYSEPLCSKECTKEEIARHINVLITKRINLLAQYQKVLDSLLLDRLF